LFLDEERSQKVLKQQQRPRYFGASTSQEQEQDYGTTTKLQELESRITNHELNCVERQLEVIKLGLANTKTYAASTAKANEYSRRTTLNKTAASYNLMRRLVGGQREWNEEVQPNTQGLKYYSGSVEDKTAAEKNAYAPLNKHFDMQVNDYVDHGCNTGYHWSWEKYQCVRDE